LGLIVVQENHRRSSLAGTTFATVTPEVTRVTSEPITLVITEFLRIFLASLVLMIFHAGLAPDLKSIWLNTIPIEIGEWF
jgi:hypothetical protein